MFQFVKKSLKNLYFYQFIVNVMAQDCTVRNNEVVCKRLQAVMGNEGKNNDVIVCKNTRHPSSQHVIYFGGDVQDYKENMEVFNHEYTEWNLEATAKLMLSRFKDATIFVIKPSEMLLNTFSIYRNFLNFDEDGRPEFSPDFGAILHLVQLYNNAKSLVASDPSLQGAETCAAARSEQPGCSDVHVKLVGFSKGCVVINQLMFELNSFKGNAEVNTFLDQLTTIYWLDGGHIGRQNAYITNIDILKSIVALSVEVVVHVSAYQIKDVNRPWIGREEREFVTKLEDLKANIKEFQHFMNETGSLANHWKVLTKV